MREEVRKNREERPEDFKAKMKEWTERLQPERLTEHLRTFKTRTGTGTDHMPLQPWKQLPGQVLKGLSALFVKCLEELTLPDTAAVNSLHLLAKKTRFRTCATMWSFTRLCFKVVAEDVRVWDRAYATPNDSAKPEVRSDDAVFARQVQIETWLEAGQPVFQALGFDSFLQESVARASAGGHREA
jgi:hypothetical protein